MSEKKELSQLGRQLLGQSAAVTLFTQEEFDKALAEAYDDFMKYAIDATKQAVLIEREECAKLADECTDIEKLGEKIRNRIPSQRH